MNNLAQLSLTSGMIEQRGGADRAGHPSWGRRGQRTAEELDRRNLACGATQPRAFAWTTATSQSAGYVLSRHDRNLL